MTIVTYKGKDEVFELTAEGHAGYAEKGQDIVCAGVSAIVYALIGWLENNIESYVSIDERNGEVVIACEGDEQVEAVFYMAAIGIENIANTYPDHVEIDIVGLAD